MNNKELEECLNFAKSLAKEAGVIMQRYFRADDIGIVWKSDKSPVTLADTTINSLVIERVQKIFPNHGVHGEEESLHEGRPWMWICDPVDGTVPYSLGLPISTFSLALTYNGVSQLGVIYDPFIDRLYYAQLSKGAFLNSKPLRVSDQRLDGSYVGCDQWATGNVNFDKVWLGIPQLRDALLDAGVKPLTLSSAVITGALIARGDIAGEIFAVTKPEDIAALKVIVEEAGGKVTDIRGNDQRYDQSINGAIVSNGAIHDQLIEIVEQCVS